MDRASMNAGEQRQLSKMELEASNFVAQFPWAPQVARKILCYGIAEIVSIFLFKFSEKISDLDDSLWIVVGDLPSAYLVVEDNYNPQQAMITYCGLMEDWCYAIEGERNLSEVYPVEAPATKENAELLRKRINFLREEIIPDIPQSLPS